MKKSWVAILATVLLAGAGCADANQSNEPSGVSQGVECEYPADGEPARPVDPPRSSHVPNQGTVGATLHISGEEVHLELDRGQAPCTVNSFLSLAEQGYYDDTDCHRLVDQGIFILQCGDPTATGTGGPGYTIADEVADDLAYPAGTVAMAKRQQPDTGGSQFFLVWADTPLPPEYTVFATMDEDSVAVIAGIAAQGVDAADQTSPIAPATISHITLG